MIPESLGIDFDNTIVCYDHVFAPAAVEMGLLAPGFRGGKAAVKAAIRTSAAGEDGWMRLQGQVYGRFMTRARLHNGVPAFLVACRERGVPVRIISHKTEHGHFDDARVNLRDAALRWMTDTGLFDTAQTGLTPGRVHFETTRDAKIQRIAESGCSDFIDDLPEVLLDPAFPSGVGRHLILADVGAGGGTAEGIRTYRGWSDLYGAFFG